MFEDIYRWLSTKQGKQGEQKYTNQGKGNINECVRNLTLTNKYIKRSFSRFKSAVGFVLISTDLALQGYEKPSNSRSLQCKTIIIQSHTLSKRLSTHTYDCQSQLRMRLLRIDECCTSINFLMKDGRETSSRELNKS